MSNVSSSPQSRYLIQSRIARGGQGEVFRALDQKTGRMVALKKPLSSSLSSERKRFQREIAAIRHLNHPNIVKVLDASTSKSDPFLVMELLDTWSSLAQLSVRKKFSDVELLLLAGQALEALSVVHAAATRIHRDISPENILIAGEGKSIRLKLIDFGVVFKDMDSRLTSDGNLVGRPGFMAPELLLATEQIKPSAQHDLYSLGATLWYAACAELPFFPQATDFPQAISFFYRNAPERAWLPSRRFETGDTLAHLLCRLLDWSPELRFRSAASAGQWLARGGIAPSSDRLATRMQGMQCNELKSRRNDVLSIHDGESSASLRWVSERTLVIYWNGRGDSPIVRRVAECTHDFVSRTLAFRCINNTLGIYAGYNVRLTVPAKNLFGALRQYGMTEMVVVADDIAIAMLARSFCMGMRLKCSVFSTLNDALNYAGEAPLAFDVPAKLS